MEKMTIHRALAELKLIDSRIEKGINAIEPSGMKQEGKSVNNFYEEKDFIKSAESKLQSVTDLIERKNKIKSAIVMANGVTKVVISGKEMTIADAINHKNTIEFKKTLCRNLTSKHNNVKSNVEQNNAQIDANAIKLAEAALQKDNVKINDGDAIAITEPFIKKNRFHLVDPLGVEKLVDEMEEEISEFETEVDAVLSEINAITIIKIK